MKRYPLIVCLLVAISIFAHFKQSILEADDGDTQIQTHVQAAKLASELANDKCHAVFGVSPFTPESYKAQLMGERWHWGKIEPPGIHSYSAEVLFNVDGSDQKVRVVFHTDKITMQGIPRDDWRKNMEMGNETDNKEEMQILENNDDISKKKP